MKNISENTEVRREKRKKSEVLKERRIRAATDRQIDRQASRQAGRHTDRLTDRQLDRHTDRQGDDREADRQTDKQTDRQTDRQDRHRKYTQINTDENKRPRALVHASPRVPVRLQTRVQSPPDKSAMGVRDSLN